MTFPGAEHPALKRVKLVFNFLLQSEIAHWPTIGRDAIRTLIKQVKELISS